MIIRGVKLRIETESGPFGFNFTFARNLTIIRAKNSSGKSTLFNSLLYGLGMEEIVGGKGERALVYAVKDHLDLDGKTIQVTASEVMLEIENGIGEVVTLRRAIRDSARSTKLIEVFQCAHLTQGDELGAARSTYLHDAGGAMKEEGFHRFLETFLGITLPQVPTANAGTTKLYLQTIFAALAVEQKRGWTDYIANIPFYGIRDARTRVAEFLLGLGVFETNAKRSRLNAESVAIDTDWRRVLDGLRQDAREHGVVVDGVSSAPSASFSAGAASIQRLTSGSPIPVGEYIAQLRQEYALLQEKGNEFNTATGSDVVKEIDKVTAELQRLNVLYERATALHGEQKISVREYELLLDEAKEDLERNKTAAKLRDIGGQSNLSLANDRCPTCHQPVEDTLLFGAVSGPQMDLAANIGYLESQSRMLERQIAGLRDGIKSTEVRITELARRIAATHDHLASMRSDVNSGASASKAIVRRQVQIEVEVESLERLSNKANEAFAALSTIAGRLKQNQSERALLPKNAYTADDEARIGVFQMQFRANAGSFGYESAPIAEVEICKDTLVPSLAQLELREIRTDIKSDSSASDFVRLIWSYLLALYQTSAVPSMPGNHPGLLMFDEPGQHSMAVDSQHALLKQLASETTLQSIVAASFDEAEEVFQQATAGIGYKLIEWEGKLLRELSTP